VVSQRRIYREFPDLYEHLVRAEDADQNLAAAFHSLLPSGFVTVLDIGAGTGRIGRVLAASLSRDALCVAIDVEESMLTHGRRLRESMSMVEGTLIWAPVVGDARALPVPRAVFDVAIAGWVLGHICEWNPGSWRREIALAVEQACTAVRAGELVTIVDTLGSAVESAAAPSPLLADFHDWLEQNAFSKIVIETDYVFGSIREAIHLLGFFFGPDCGEKVRRSNNRRVREFTGVWWRRQ
jgi:SAM-dependent methyltransferase